MTCPECNSSDIELTNKKSDGQGYYEEEDYVCNKCHCEWTWRMEKEITKHKEIK